MIILRSSLSLSLMTFLVSVSQCLNIINDTVNLRVQIWSDSSAQVRTSNRQVDKAGMATNNM